MPPTLRRSELSDALGFVRAAAEAEDSEAFRRHLLDGLPRLVPSSMVSYNDMSPGRAPLLLLDPPDAMTAERVTDFLRLAGQNPLIAHYMRTADPRPMKISDLMDRRAFRRTELYRTVYRPMGVEYQMAFALPAAPGAIVGVALNRDRSDFTERDRAVLELVRPHLGQARRDAAARETVRLLSAIIERTLGDEGRAALAVGPDGGIAFASGEALALLGRYLSPPPSPGVVPEAIAAWRRPERDRGRAPSGDLVVDGPAGRLLARLLRAPDGAGHDVILLEEHRVGHELAALAALGLSARQAEVLSLVARGSTNAQIAALLHLSPRTVQKHLEHVYDRLGVRSRAAATALAVDAVRRPR